MLVRSQATNQRPAGRTARTGDQNSHRASLFSSLCGESTLSRETRPTRLHRSRGRTYGSPKLARGISAWLHSIEATCCRIAGSRRVLARMRVSDVCNGGTRRLTFLQNNDDTDCDTIRGTRGTKEDWHEQA